MNMQLHIYSSCNCFRLKYRFEIIVLLDQSGGCGRDLRAQRIPKRNSSHECEEVLSLVKFNLSLVIVKKLKFGD